MPKLGPQPGAQTLFAQNSADIAIFAGQPGAGKSVALTLELMRWIDRPHYRGTAYRRLSKQLFDGGGLFDLLTKHGRALGLIGVRSPIPMHTARSGATISLQHLQHGIKTALGQDGKGFDLLCFDELTHFDADSFWYLALTRNRSTDPRTGFAPYVRASTMAQADTFVHELVKPWLLPDGWPDYEQSGRVRWIVRNPNSDLFEFFLDEHDAQDFVDACKASDPRLKLRPKSLSVVHAVTEENIVLMRGNPNYAADQGNLSRLERLQKQGNWEARAESAGLFSRQWFGVRDEVHENEIAFSVRGWDKASTKPSEANPDPDYTCGLRLDLLHSGVVLVSSVVRIRDRPGVVQDLIAKTCAADGPKVTQSFWRDPGQAGAQDEEATRNLLALVRGCGPVVFTGASKSKISYAMPASVYADRTAANDRPMTAGMAVLRNRWNADYFVELEEFPRAKNTLGQQNHDDQVDAQSAAWQVLIGKLPAQVTGAATLENLMARIKL